MYGNSNTSNVQHHDGPFNQKLQSQGNILKMNPSAHDQLWSRFKLMFLLAILFSITIVFLSGGQSFTADVMMQYQHQHKSSSDKLVVGKTVVKAKHRADFDKKADAAKYDAQEEKDRAESEADEANAGKEKAAMNDGAEAKATAAAAGGEGGGSGGCDRSVVPTSRDELLSNIISGLDVKDHPETVGADKTKHHLDALNDAMLEHAPCIRKARSVLHGEAGTKEVARVFVDLGSREIDSSKTFLRTFPNAKEFHIHCFEANPKFNKLYEKFNRESPNVRLTYHNQAFGVENTTLVLSDRSVGSSIVSDGGAKKNSDASGGTKVGVIDAVAFFAYEVAPEIASKKDSYVVMKMDIEKMEFSVLHRMVRLGVFSLVDDLLLECHYNTNKARDKRDPKIHIGLDDCKTLVQSFNKLLEKGEDGGAGRPFVSVLWNSPKTARGSGYGASHGGFFPT